MILPPLNWPTPPEEPRLQRGDIHLWRIPLDDASKLAAARAVLSREETARAARFVFDSDRDRFIASHGAMRMVLARYVASDPSELQFQTGRNGKPTLVQTFTDVRFNLSHSGDLALIAVARGREVGVDVERVQKDVVFEQIADHYFEPNEAWDLRIAPPDERVMRFFDLWTRKEACLKAEGTGLDSRPRPDRFGVRNLSPASGYAGAVASEGDDWQLACWEWSV
jgi:4'-phosphopantetheinyl transferase